MGRPKGARNKPKGLVEAIAPLTPVGPAVPAKRRGRPPGSKNKPKEPAATPRAVEEIQAMTTRVAAVALLEQRATEDIESIPKRRGRPPGSKNKDRMSAPVQYVSSLHFGNMVSEKPQSKVYDPIPFSSPDGSLIENGDMVIIDGVREAIYLTMYTRELVQVDLGDGTKGVLNGNRLTILEKKIAETS